MTLAHSLRPGQIVRGAVLPEAVEVLAVVPLGGSAKLIGRGLQSGRVVDRVLDAGQLAQLVVSGGAEAFDGDAARFRLGVEATRLELAYEYDPYFCLSIARVDPLPHQLEAVYEQFLRAPRLRFLLADDPGAGKTIMAGLLLKELKIRGLARRTLIVAPANLTFQWQREMKDKFREDFDLLRGDVLRTRYGRNPWQERSQVVTSVAWISRIEEARESLLRSRWDLVIVDEAHKMSAASEDKKTLAFKVGEALSERTDHLLLMTATPHKGDPQNFRLFLSLLDRDVYADVASLEEAMRRQSAPFYLRRTKESLVTFPDEAGICHPLFPERKVKTVRFELDGDEFEFYLEITRFVEDQSIRAAATNSAEGRAVGFTMAMLQRRFASSLYAARRTLERMRERRQKILDDPAAYLRQQVERKLPDDFEELPEEEQERILEEQEAAVLSPDPAVLREEIRRLDELIGQARTLEAGQVESKLTKLRQVLAEQQIFGDARNKLLIFTEHKETLDYLVGDGRDGRPMGKLRQWGLRVTQIHGGMKIGDPEAPGTRLHAEQEFRESAQVMVATEAAGEGINLQFCWLMINYDIPWSPVRLEQRMGRIHRYGQPHDCLISNFVAINTREGAVLSKLLYRLEEIRKELQSDKVFDVVGELFPSNRLERLFREMYARKLTATAIEERVAEAISAERIREITESALEGLAKRQLNLSKLMGNQAEARERRLVPEVVEGFFRDGAVTIGLPASEHRGQPHVYRLGRLPRALLTQGERLEPQFGKLAGSFERICFDRRLLQEDSTRDWITPGHPLFEALRAEVQARASEDLERGAVFFDLQTEEPYRLDVFTAAIRDGRGQALHRRLFLVRVDASGELSVRQPTLFLDLSPAPSGTPPPLLSGLPDRSAAEAHLLSAALEPLLAEVQTERERAISTVSHHVEISLQALISRQNLQIAALYERQRSGETATGLAGQIAQADAHVTELLRRRNLRREELDRERVCSIADLAVLGRAWVLPHPRRDAPEAAGMVEDPEIEAIAIAVATRYEEARGCVVESVEAENRGYDLLSKRFDPQQPERLLEVRHIEVKGRSAVGDVGLSPNEYRVAHMLREDYWLYAVFDCATTPSLNLVRDPARLGWTPVVVVDHYRLGAKALLEASVEP